MVLVYLYFLIMIIDGNHCSSIFYKFAYFDIFGEEQIWKFLLFLDRERERECKKGTKNLLCQSAKITKVISYLWRNHWSIMKLKTLFVINQKLGESKTETREWKFKVTKNCCKGQVQTDLMTLGYCTVYNNWKIGLWSHLYKLSIFMTKACFVLLVWMEQIKWRRDGFFSLRSIDDSKLCFLQTLNALNEALHN